MSKARQQANLSSDGNLFADISNDRVGIGSVVPTHKLHVNGTSKFDDDVKFEGTAAANNIIWDKSADRLNFSDIVKASFGAGGDLTIYHNGSNSYLDNGTGDLYLRPQSDIYWQNLTSGDVYLKGINNGAVEIYYDGNKKFETLNTGAKVTGNLEVTGVLTYDDVTSVDSVGVVTARAGVHIDDSIVHIGDTDTKIRFPAANNISFETQGTERFRIYDSNSNGGVAKFTTPTSGDMINLQNSSGGGQGLILGVDTSAGYTYWKNNTTASYDAAFIVGGTEKVRIKSGGAVQIGNLQTGQNTTTHTSATKLHIDSTKHIKIARLAAGSVSSAGWYTVARISSGEGNSFKCYASIGGNFTQDVCVMELTGSWSASGGLSNTYAEPVFTAYRTGAHGTDRITKARFVKDGSNVTYLQIYLAAGVDSNTWGKSVLESTIGSYSQNTADSNSYAMFAAGGTVTNIRTLEVDDNALCVNAGSHKFYSGGNATERLTISSAGEVQIATRNSSSGGDLGFRFGSFGIRSQDTGGYNYWHIDRNYGGWQSNMVSFKADGKVGINEATPERQLDVNGDILGTAYMLKSNSSASSGSQAHMFRPADNTLAFATNGANERLRIGSTGKLTFDYDTSENNLADIDFRTNNGLQIRGHDGNSNNAKLYIGGSVSNQRKTAIIHDPAGGYCRGDLHFCLENAADLSDVDVSDSKMVIKADGKVLIGDGTTYNPSGLLHIVGDNNSNGPELYLQVNNNNTTDNIGALWFGNNADKSIVKLAGHTHTANNTGDFTVSTSSGGTLTEKLRISSSGSLQSKGNGAIFEQVETNSYNSSWAAANGKIAIKGDLSGGNYFGWRQKSTASGSVSQANAEKKLPTINDFTYPNSSNGMIIASTSKIGFAAAGESPQYSSGVTMLFDHNGLILGGSRAFDCSDSVSGATTALIKLRGSQGKIELNSPSEQSGRLTIKGANSSGSSCYTVTNSGKAVQGIDVTCTTVGDGNFGGAISFGCGGNGRSAIAARQEGSDDDKNGLAFFTHVSTNGADNAVERLRLNADSSILHTRSDNVQRYDLEFRQTGGIGTGNYSGVKWTQGSTGGTFLAGILMSYHDTGRPDMVFYHRDEGGGTGSDEVMRLDRDGVLYFNSGYGSSAKAYGIRAWINFDMTNSSIRDSGNVASVTDHGVGDFAISFSNNIVDNDYAIGGTATNWEGTNVDSYCHIGVFKDGLQSSSFRIKCIRSRFDQQPPQFKDSNEVMLTVTR